MLAICSCRFLSWISSNNRTFSIAITARSAKVLTSSICFSVNGSTVARVKVKTPMESRSRNSGTPGMVRNGSRGNGRGIQDRRVPHQRARMRTIRRVDTRCPAQGTVSQNCAAVAGHGRSCREACASLPIAEANRSAQSDAGEHPTQGHARRAPERAPGAPRGGRRVPARLQDGLGGNCFEAAWIALSIWAFTRLAQVQESRRRPR